jgi:hypothetical protein
MAARGHHRLVLTLGDKILLCALLLLSLGSIPFLRQLVDRGTMAVVEVDGREIVRLDLSVDCQRIVTGPLGETILLVKDGRVRVTESACPNKICVRSGWADKTGDLIVCVPNRVVVWVEGAGEVDATTW